MRSPAATHGVLHEPRLVLLLRHLPQLFQPDAVFLRAALGIEAEAADQLLGERAPRALGEQRVFAGERDAGV